MTGPLKNRDKVKNSLFKLVDMIIATFKLFKNSKFTEINS